MICYNYFGYNEDPWLWNISILLLLCVLVMMLLYMPYAYLCWSYANFYRPYKVGLMKSIWQKMQATCVSHINQDLWSPYAKRCRNHYRPYKHIVWFILTWYYIIHIPKNEGTTPGHINQAIYSPYAHTMQATYADTKHTKQVP